MAWLDHLAAGTDVPLARGMERVEIALLDPTNLYFPSIAHQARSDRPFVRANARRVLDWAETFTGVVLVIDSQEARVAASQELVAHVGRAVDLERTRSVLQLNKRDLPTALSLATLREAIPVRGAAYVPSIATRGEGVRTALEAAIRPGPW